MHDAYKQQVLEALNSALSTSLDNSPEHGTFVMVRDHLANMGVPIDMAEAAVAKAHLAVDPEIFADAAFMNEVTLLFAKVMYREYDFATRKLNSHYRFLELIEGMSLTLAPPQ